MLIEHETLEFSRSKKTELRVVLFWNHFSESEYRINRMTCEYYLNLLTYNLRIAIAMLDTEFNPLYRSTVPCS